MIKPSKATIKKLAFKPVQDDLLDKYIIECERGGERIDISKAALRALVVEIKNFSVIRTPSLLDE